MTCPEFTNWREAFDFAHSECMAAFEAMASADFAAAEALNQSAREANQLAKLLLAQEPSE